MDRQEWEYSAHSLRLLLKKLREEEGLPTREIEYKFGLLYNPMFNYFHLWNGVSRNCIATIKIETHRVIVRYRPKSWYVNEILKFRLEGKKAIFVPSDSLDRHRIWVSRGIQERVNRAIRQRRDFLAMQRVVESSQPLQTSGNLAQRPGYGSVSTSRREGEAMLVSVPLVMQPLRIAPVGSSITMDQPSVVEIECRSSTADDGLIRDLSLMVHALESNQSITPGRYSEHEIYERYELMLSLLNNRRIGSPGVEAVWQETPIHPPIQHLGPSNRAALNEIARDYVTAATAATMRWDTPPMAYYNGTETADASEAQSDSRPAD